MLDTCCGPQHGCKCRQALAAKAPKGAPPPPQDDGPRTILKMTQKFGRNPEVPAEQDVARRVFDIANGHIRSGSYCRLLLFQGFCSALLHSLLRSQQPETLYLHSRYSGLMRS